jgi:hypothetical protein
VIVAVGYNAEVETEGADREFQLPPGQDELIEKIAAVNPNTIVTVTSGGAVDASKWIDHIAALLENWYPGQEGGTALAEVVFGDVNPSGRLPISWERSLSDNPSYPYYYPTPGTLQVPYKDEVFVGYRGYEHNGVKPLFPFGYGLSYTSFKYSGLDIQARSGPRQLRSGLRCDQHRLARRSRCGPGLCERRASASSAASAGTEGLRPRGARPRPDPPRHDAARCAQLYLVRREGRCVARRCGQLHHPCEPILGRSCNWKAMSSSSRRFCCP